jgi:hypothetical protein
VAVRVIFEKRSASTASCVIRQSRLAKGALLRHCFLERRGPRVDDQPGDLVSEVCKLETVFVCLLGLLLLLLLGRLLLLRLFEPVVLRGRCLSKCFEET